MKFTYYVVEKDGKYLNGERWTSEIKNANLFHTKMGAEDYRSNNPTETVKMVKVEVL